MMNFSLSIHYTIKSYKFFFLFQLLVVDLFNLIIDIIKKYPARVVFNCVHSAQEYNFCSFPFRIRSNVSKFLSLFSSIVVFPSQH